jgi:hypothetical protein
MLSSLMLAASLTASEIPAVVRDVFIATDPPYSMSNPGVVYSIENRDKGNRLIAFSIQLVLEYPNGEKQMHGYTRHCHTAITDEQIAACEIEPGSRKQQAAQLFTRPPGHPFPTPTFTILGAVFEGKAGERWVGARQPLEDILKGDEQGRENWREVLRILETVKKEGSGVPSLKHAMSMLTDPSQKNEKIAEVRKQLERAIAQPSSGDTLEVLVQLARSSSMERRPHGRQ